MVVYFECWFKCVEESDKKIFGIVKIVYIFGFEELLDSDDNGYLCFNGSVIDNEVFDCFDVSYLYKFRFVLVYSGDDGV